VNIGILQIDPAKPAGLGLQIHCFERLDIVPRKRQPPSIETAMLELEKLVETLEQGDLPLEESLKTFERGVTLTRVCQEALDEAEQKIKILSGETDDAELTPFEDDHE
jgi:exodeoxyribonuclease VII small subunit